MEKQILSLVDTEVLIGVLAAKQCAMIHAKQEEAYQELNEAIKYVNERLGELFGR